LELSKGRSGRPKTRIRAGKGKIISEFLQTMGNQGRKTGAEQIFCHGQQQKLLHLALLFLNTYRILAYQLGYFLQTVHYSAYCLV
jgi:hypothetical protein